jgi:hypothetical protein
MLKRDTTAHNFANQLLNLYLESRATPGISASAVIKARMAAGNRSHYAPTKIMKSREISKSTKLKIHRTVIRPVVMCGCKGWTMSEHNGGGSQSMGKKDLKEGTRPEKGHKWMENS